MDQPKPPITFPARMGFILGILYCILIFIENKGFSSNMLLFGATKSLGYLIILGGLLYTAIQLKKRNGGFITFQECLRGLLVTIAIMELFYVLFNFIYVKYMDPQFFAHLKESTLDFLQKANLSKEEIKNRMASFEGAGNMTVWSVIQSYGFAIIIDAVFAVIFASILKRNPPLTDNQKGF